MVFLYFLYNNVIFFMMLLKGKILWYCSSAIWLQICNNEILVQEQSYCPFYFVYMDNGQIAGLSNQKIKIFLQYDLNSIIQNNNILEHLFERIIEKLRLISLKYRFIVVNATFNNISIILWPQFYWWRKPNYQQKTTNLSLVTKRLYYILYVLF